MSDNEKRIERERSIVRGLIRALAQEDWKPYQVDDGGDDRLTALSERQMMNAATGVDEATLYFRNPDAPKLCSVLIVWGNDNDVIADHSDPDGDPHRFVATINAYIDVVCRD